MDCTQVRGITIVMNLNIGSHFCPVIYDELSTSLMRKLLNMVVVNAVHTQTYRHIQSILEAAIIMEAAK
jgi:hypothetical protein